MNELNFIYGVMGSSKSANALMCKFNYEQRGFTVALLKPVVDTRDMEDGEPVVSSRIGLKSKCLTFSYDDKITDILAKTGLNYNVLIIDEAQFCSAKQIDECKEISSTMPVFCYGLKTNFKSLLFEGSKRLVEIADNISEIHSVCRCGDKSMINARFVDGKVVTSGEDIVIGGDEKYEAMCYGCWKEQQDDEEMER